MMHTVFTRHARRASALAVAFAWILLSPPALHAQSSVHNNPGLNGTQDADLGEFAIDLGGFVPFSTYENPSHYWVDALNCGPIRQIMLDFSTNLVELDATLRACSGGTGIFPPDIQFEGSQTQGTWWSTTADFVTVWKFRINGGPVLIVLRNGPRPDPMNILMYNTASHISDFGTTRGSGPPFNDFDFVDAFTSSNWPWPYDDGGAPNLLPVEQAIERGDLVVMVKENVGQDFWTALQRTQDAEHFARNEFQTIYAGEALPLDRSFVDGSSWGGQVSAMFALLQSGVYSGAMASFGHDIGYHLPGVGDWDRLNSHRRAGTGQLEPSRAHSDQLTKDFFLLVDVLGSRFDGPDTAFGMQPWDLGAFSINHRAPSELKIPIVSRISAEELFIHPDWQRGDNDTRSNLQVDYVRNLEHGGPAGVADGFNEFFVFAGDEWENLLAISEGPSASNVELVPDRAPDCDVTAYPDPYAHTLRHQPRNDHYGPDLLDALPLNAESASQAAIGQGVWPGNHDSMRAGDFDGDGNIEVVFGNFEGFLHVLELDLSSGAARLVDEWRSENLGWGMWAATQGAIDDGGPIVFGDNLGQLHRLESIGHDLYDITSPSRFTRDSMRERMGHSVSLIYEGGFAGSSGDELIALNQYLDWVMLDENGNHLGTRRRDTDAVGPGMSCVVDLDEDGRDELLVPGLDGGLWGVSYDGSDFQTQQLILTDRALRRVEPAGLCDTSPCPNFVVAMGRNDDLPDGQENRYLLIQMEPTVEVKADLRAFASLDRPHFAWMHDASQDNRSFFSGSLSVIERIRVDGTGMVCECTAEMPTLFFTDGVQVGSDICGIEYVPTGVNTGYVFVATGNGRIYVLDQDLNFQYLATDEWAGDPDAPTQFIPFPWYSNRTVGHVFGSDLYQQAFDGSADEGEASFYWAEYTQPMWRRGALQAFRVGRIGLNEDGSGEWDALESFTAPLVSERRVLTRTFIYQDLIEDGNPEAYFLAEAGTVLVEDGQARRFSNRAIDLSIFPGAIGGCVFEFFSNTNYAVLDGWSTPKDGVSFDNGQADDWWYPKVGSTRIGGQIANHSQSVTALYDGSSMESGRFVDPSEDGEPVDHVVTGTYGGYVYALRPGQSFGNSTPSNLSYLSEDLGSRVIGLDTGDLDGDGVDEVVAGTWLDTGGFDDWVDGDEDRNRGHLLVLKARAPEYSDQPGALEVIADLGTDHDWGDDDDGGWGDDDDGGWGDDDDDGGHHDDDDGGYHDDDDGDGVGRGLASGVFGVKIDDVNGDGQPEIWAGDALGRVYLFVREDCGGHHGDDDDDDGGSEGQRWRSLFVSAELGAYAGMYNGIYPVKDAEGKTVRLVVQTSGYVHAFEVDHYLVPSEDDDGGHGDDDDDHGDDDDDHGDDDDDHGDDDDDHGGDDDDDGGHHDDDDDGGHHDDDDD